MSARVHKMCSQPDRTVIALITAQANTTFSNSVPNAVFRTMASVVVHVDANESVNDTLRVRQRQLCVVPQHTVAHPVHEERDVLRRAHALLLAVRPHGPDVPVDLRLAAGLLRA